MTIGERIKAAREKTGMTQVELGEKVGVSGVAIMRYEKGQRQPRYDLLLHIADALGVSAHTLVDWGEVDKEAFKELFIWGEGLDDDSSGNPPKLIEEDGLISTPEVVEHSATPEELEALMAKLQDGKPLVLSPEELAKLKATPKEQVAAALDKVGQEEQKQIVRISAPLYKLRGVPPERRERLEKLKDQAVRYEHSLGITGLGKSTMINALLANAPQRRIATALGKLNEEGQEKAAERVEELTEIPRYRRQEPAQKLTKEELRESLKRLGMDKLLPDGPQDTPAPQEGTDTTPAEAPLEGPQEPPEGRIQSITMICPICGMTLRGDPATGKAFCRYCNRSFPLSKKARGPRR